MNNTNNSISSLTIKEGLIKTREIILDPIHWTQKYFARNSDGEFVEPLQGGAVCWCLSGALCKSIREYNVFNAAFDFLSHKLNPNYNPHVDLNPIVVFNDTHTHQEIINFLDESINELK